MIFPPGFSGDASFKGRCRVEDEAVAQGVRGGLVHVSEFRSQPKMEYN